MKKIAIVIPCYKSAHTIGKVVEDIEEFFALHTENTYQVILVNDGSGIETSEAISQICEKNPNVIGLELSRNYGQASARMAGLHQASGDIIVCMDDDGQHPVNRMSDLISEVEAGYDVVYAKFHNKKTSTFKIVTSRITRRVYEKIGIIPKGVFVSSYFAINGKYLGVLQEYTSPFPSIGAFLLQYTYSFKNVDMEQEERIEGKSGYHLKSLFRLFFNSITNFSIVPIHWITQIGGFFIGLSIALGIVLGILGLLGNSFANGYTILADWIMFFSGGIIATIGFLGEYIGRIYMTISDKPQYHVNRIFQGKAGEER